MSNKKIIFIAFAMLISVIFIGYFQLKVNKSNDDYSFGITDSFRIENFAGNRSLEKTLVLNDDFGYWKITVKNMGTDDIKVGISTEDGISIIPSGEWYIYNTEKWKSGVYTVTFISDAGMYGNASCRISSSSELLSY